MESYPEYYFPVSNILVRNSTIHLLLRTTLVQNCALNASHSVTSINTALNSIILEFYFHFSMYVSP